MKRSTVMTLLVTFVLILAGYGLVQAHGGFNSSWNPMGGSWGHMGRYGHMMDYGSYLDSSCWSRTPETFSGKIDVEEAQDIVAWHLKRTNDRLKVDKVTETEDGFEVRIVTRKGEALVDKLLVEKDTGRIYRVYE